MSVVFLNLGIAPRATAALLRRPTANAWSRTVEGSKVHPYGSVGRTVGDWFIHLARANFRVDQILEPGVSDISPVPTTLIVRAVKEGD